MEPAREWAERTRSKRWGFAFALGVLAVALAIAAYYTDQVRICTEQVSNGAVVEVCSPPSLAQLALLFLPGVLLLLPDVIEVNFLGVGLRRDVEETRAEVVSHEGLTADQGSALIEAVSAIAKRVRDIETVLPDLVRRLSKLEDRPADERGRANPD